MQKSQKVTENTSPASNGHEDAPYGLGLALSGGGARGFAHAGALKAIKEAGLKVDIIAGVSAGSIVAALHAGGVSPEDMVKLFDKTRLKNLMEFRLGSGGLLSMTKFIKRMEEILAPAKNLEDLQIPVYIGATDLANAKTTVFDHGPIGERVMASCSIPLLFSPVNIDGNWYVDGGVIQNLPARVIRDKCRRLIGINVVPMSPLGKATSMLDVAIRTYHIMVKSNQQRDLDVCDLVVETRELSAYQTFNIKDRKNVFNAGYTNMRRTLRRAGWWNPDNEE